MTLLHEPPTLAEPVREELPPAHVPLPMRNLAMALIAILVITAGVVVALIAFDSGPSEIHDSWMNVPGAVQTVEIHDSWMG